MAVNAKKLFILWFIFNQFVFLDITNHPPALFVQIAAMLQLEANQVQVVCNLLANGSTIPFIARYRKELTGSLNEVDLAQIRDEAIRLMQLHKRRLSILESIQAQNKLDNKIEAAIWACNSLPELEDLYLPFKPKKRTRATVAKEQGLEPLANWLWDTSQTQAVAEAQKYIKPDQGVPDVASALAGAKDILAERINEMPAVRQALRQHLQRSGQVETQVVKAKATQDQSEKFKDYFNFSEPIQKMPSHRVLAVLRGVDAGIIRIKICPDEGGVDAILARNLPRKQGQVGQLLWEAATDAYKRLAYPALENECLNHLKQQADLVAVEVFKQNLKNLLLAPPLGRRRVLGIDPGFRTGCKLVCLSETGVLLAHHVAYIVGSAKEQMAAAKLINDLIQNYKLEAIAVGNGTASRETEKFLQQTCIHKIPIILVNESGASIYSASEVAREEFPNHDITVRGAVSIGRRLLDPLSELVKIDPKSIGVGQYQHDVNQTLLQTSLADTVVSCVNGVGVDLNTASASLLQYVSGFSKQLGAQLVAYRTNNGPFKSRHELLKVPRLGPKTFEQAAGFLRIPDAKNPLDASAVHPERYDLVERMASDLSVSIAELISREELLAKINLAKYTSADVGMPTLLDLMEELRKPGRDPRTAFKQVKFNEQIQKPADLTPGMLLQGVVTNVTNFGAFVDIGVHQDGLIHVSQLSDKYVSDATLVVKVGELLQVKVLEVDLARKRISLTRKGL